MTSPKDLEAKLAELVEVPILIASTQRPVVLMVPPDLTDAELLEVLSFMTLRNEAGLVHRLRAARPRIIVASGLEAMT